MRAHTTENLLAKMIKIEQKYGINSGVVIECYPFRTQIRVKRVVAKTKIHGGMQTAKIIIVIKSTLIVDTRINDKMQNIK